MSSNPASPEHSSLPVSISRSGSRRRSLGGCGHGYGSSHKLVASRVCEEQSIPIFGQPSAPVLCFRKAFLCVSLQDSKGQVVLFLIFQKTNASIQQFDLSV